MIGMGRLIPSSSVGLNVVGKGIGIEVAAANVRQAGDGNALVVDTDGLVVDGVVLVVWLSKV